jgi:hypothetical protein
MVPYPEGKRVMTELQTGGLAARFYRSYLVRFWQSNEQGSWRASAQCVQTGQTVLFGDVASLLTFLQSEVLGCTFEGDNEP